MGEILGTLATQGAEPLAGVDLGAINRLRREAVHVHQANPQVEAWVFEPDAEWATSRVAGSGDSTSHWCHDRVASAVGRCAGDDQVPGQVQRTELLNPVGTADVGRR